ncbi:DUF4406 domain-containing protein [Saccharicrinis aurantiacus]|uniref:DUF4406 domain-containing protein n=1 Tax=Saccharicrinis aurantiacus TaxID=1849719 RepID=UPI00094FCE43|nr:DUF4406 domain-containing protein [Saccharicrinis aurantiacus]
MIIYISGINHETDMCALNQLKIDLLDLGCTLIIPEEKELDKLTWSENISLRLSFINSCRIIYMLPSWRESLIARIELTAAMDTEKLLCFSLKEIKDLITTLDS